MITNIFLAAKGLEGPISQSLGILAELQYLDLSHNSLYGALPLELVSSSSMIILDVSFNQLNGTLGGLSSSTPSWPLQVLNISSNLFIGEFPSSMWKTMANLVTLNASNNSFTGQIPTQLCNTSPFITVLDLSFNKFSGSIPPGLGDCSMLRELRAGYNNISGTLPDELFNVTSLEYLSFPNNGLGGVLDSARIVSLRNLVTLDLAENILSGKIPKSIGHLQRLEELHLNNNNMSGELPSTLSNCTNLITIDLKINHFSGELTKFNFSNLPNLRTLDLYLNDFNNTVPDSIYSCSNLIALRLSSNKLDGQLSPRIGDLKSLSFLSLDTNFFRNITNALHILKNSRNLTTLLIGGNFKGELMPNDDIFDGFENLQFPEKTMQPLSHTHRKGFPTAFFSLALALLAYLACPTSSCTEQEKSSLLQLLAGLSWDGGLMASWRSDLDCCRWEGITCSPNRTVTDVSLASRGLEGSISPFLCNLTGLLRLNLSGNSLSGGLPLGLVQSSSIIVLDVSFNSLTGDLSELPSSTAASPDRPDPTSE
ncbi:hypothetical protein QYE76_020464 [Lolium multiflorum]|uniref:Leucine-rich repeat-containing N-terminal plant-type domain-containing protein n=1 Tax=Lolium multiflorum TaxID=4521 RepID=A0AAD8R5Y0_LOLMU|nr:hypothetical protein QYE76_020464 [Lolium multiflorum]